MHSHCCTTITTIYLQNFYETETLYSWPLPYPEVHVFAQLQAENFWKKKDFRRFLKVKLEFALWSSCLRSMYAVLNIVSNMQMILNKREGVYRLYASTLSFYIRG